MEEHVQTTKPTAQPLERSVDLRVLGHVARQGKPAASQLGHKLFHRLTSAFPLADEGDLRARFRPPFCHAPSDGATVCHAKDSGFSSLQRKPSGGPGGQ